MNLIKLSVGLLVMAVALTGCQNIKQTLGKRNNGSLDYQTAKKLPPIKLPVSQESVEFSPLYPTPEAGKSTIALTNESGKQYRLPKPPKVAK